MQYKQNAQQIFDVIKSSDHILLVSHEKPDGDTLGASLALSHYLDKENKIHKHYCNDKPADYFKFLPKVENLIYDYDEIELTDHDLIITLDCADLIRTQIHDDIIKHQDKITIINIDHHISNDNYGHHNLVVPDASSTSEIIYKFFDFHNILVDKYMATNLMTGIITDTMNFTNAATNQESLKIAGDLLKNGARVNQIIHQITQNQNLESLQLWGKILSRLQFNSKYNFAYTVITKKDISDSKVPIESTDGLANFLSNIEDIDFILLLTELDGNIIKGSLRTTKDNIDVAKLAQAFGGGGHKKAAGFKIKGQLKKTKKGWQIQ